MWCYERIKGKPGKDNIGKSHVAKIVKRNGQRGFWVKNNFKR
jgi:hypothetical protein